MALAGPGDTGAAPNGPLSLSKSWPALGRRVLAAGRHLNAGQTAILLALAYPEATKYKRGGSILQNEEINSRDLSHARLIEDYAPELGDQVLAKQITFEESAALKLRRRRA